jgi:hypothetical protein
LKEAPNADAVAWLHAEPYAFLQPIIRRRWFVPAAAAGTTRPMFRGS